MRVNLTHFYTPTFYMLMDKADDDEVKRSEQTREPEFAVVSSANPEPVPTQTEAERQPPAPHFPLLSGDSGRYVLILLFLGLLVRLVPAYLVYGSNDIGSWRWVIRDFGLGVNPYLTKKLNWPPLWPTLLMYTGRMQDVYHLPDYFSVKIFPILADTSIGLALYFWFVQSKWEPKTSFRRALWYTLNPIAIGNCALHGQFDALPALFSLLAIMAAVRAEPSGRLSFSSAIWLSLGVLAKTWPLIFLPILMSRIRSLPAKLLFALIVLAPSVISVAILYRQAPDIISQYVISYRGIPGTWGLLAPRIFLSHKTGILSAATGTFLIRICRFLFYAAILGVYVALWKRGNLFRAACLLLLTFYVFAPALGIQYLVWIVGLAVLADFPRLRLYTLIGSLSIYITYIFSPFNGEYFDFLARVRSPLFWASNMQQHHMIINTILGVPLWLFFVWWWLSLLRETLTESPAASVAHSPPASAEPALNQS